MRPVERWNCDKGIRLKTGKKRNIYGNTRRRNR
jgi:hypothetical protein